MVKIDFEAKPLPKVLFSAYCEMMIKSSSFESPKSYLFALYLKSSTFNICQDSLKCVNLLHKWGLVATGVGTTVCTRAPGKAPISL